ncbi:uncharacterized protein EV422DRAFT_501780 [Fimicolochytrium jonesii]|uniref:uncharacterized protein n=1 Tax=Fimicolochytrium jonesii TaxID=1396493 RepID=UPI0022FDDE6D|nr:uncharacterized protein EV422DRAFT_501780 [Fimicolochytrium jonesii]KAI8816012.1 hypothetical protein EV422DRAFT_501780 [Fimicolochytrium jonesii]
MVVRNYILGRDPGPPIPTSVTHHSNGTSGVSNAKRPSLSPYANLNEILRDSYSPALIVPFTQTHPSLKIYYAQLRRSIATLSIQPPFSHLRPGDVLTYLIPNSVEHIAVFFATTAARAVANPLNPAYTADEIAFYLKDVGSKVVVVPKGDSSILSNVQKAIDIVGHAVPVFEVAMEIKDVLRKDRPRKKRVKREKERGAPVADDVALMLHTSGTTGRPKGVPLTHANILHTLSNIQSTYRLTAADVSYLVMPLFHVHGLIGVLLSTLNSGGTTVVPPKFSVTRFWTDFIEHGSTWYSAVPTIHQMLLLKAKETYLGTSGKLRFIRSCSSSLAPATLLSLEKTFRAPVIEAYAMSEAAHQMTANFLPPGMRKPGSVGRGQGVDVIVLDEQGQPTRARQTGEVCVRGPNVITAYHNNPTATAESFYPDPAAPSDPSQKYFRTGDLGYFDVMGFLYLVGRSKEQINRGGEKISPVEIDQVLLQHRLVAEAVTFPVPSTIYGQEIEAVVVPKPSSSSSTQLTEQDLLAHASKLLAPFKVPGKIWIRSEVPKTATGKVQRRVVAEIIVKEGEGAKEEGKVRAKL